MNKLEKIVIGVCCVGVTLSSYFICKTEKNINKTDIEDINLTYSYNRLIQSLDDLDNLSIKLDNKITKIDRDLAYLKGLVDGASFSFKNSEIDKL